MRANAYPTLARLERQGIKVKPHLRFNDEACRASVTTVFTLEAPCATKPVVGSFDTLGELEEHCARILQ